MGWRHFFHRELETEACPKAGQDRPGALSPRGSHMSGIAFWGLWLTCTGAPNHGSRSLWAASCPRLPLFGPGRLSITWAPPVRPWTLASGLLPGRACEGRPWTLASGLLPGRAREGRPPQRMAGALHPKREVGPYIHKSRGLSVLSPGTPHQMSRLRPLAVAQLVSISSPSLHRSLPLQNAYLNGAEPVVLL